MIIVNSTGFYITILILKDRLKPTSKSTRNCYSVPIVHEVSMSNCPIYWHIARVHICCFMHRIFMSYGRTSKSFDIFGSLSHCRFLWFNDMLYILHFSNLQNFIPVAMKLFNILNLFPSDDFSSDSVSFKCDLL